jgi:ABC-type polysaccharide/polyol phosphate transport system ATPase subunit
MRLAYSIAIQIPFDVLLLDEVLAVGDESFQEKCFATFERFKEEGKTVILVTHDVRLLQRFADRVLKIEHGLVKAVGPTDQLIDGRPLDVAIG